MIWTGITYNHKANLNFVNGNFNMPRYHDEILQPRVRHSLDMAVDFNTIPSISMPPVSVRTILPMRTLRLFHGQLCTQIWHL